ncbi:MAG TPA: AAA domain-containing protein, partial [Polyangiales bacterium]|nr:AAA domain-containing protein [Polyangiales bacterium]
MDAARTRLSNLLGYIEEQAKEVDPTNFDLSVHRGFLYGQADLRGLPGVEVDINVDGDHVWLRVNRLVARAAPPVPEAKLRRLLRVNDDPEADLPCIHEAEFRAAFAKVAAGQGVEQRAVLLSQARTRVEHALREYTKAWLEWAAAEKPRRRTIALYGELFATKHQLESEETAKPVEFVWGIGLTRWQLEVQGQTYPFDYPLLTQQLEIALDAKTMTIEVRPRATETRFEVDAFIAGHVVGAADVDCDARELLALGRERPVTPFDPMSYVEVLRLAATKLHSAGRYDATLVERQEMSPPSRQLTVSGAWVIYVRPRTNNYLIDDLHRLDAELAAGCELPGGPATLVTPPSNQPLRFEPVNFRGLSSRGDPNRALQELYFPLPYNQEQVTIVHQLEQADGVTVQGPPGTGKTHTIANIVCHYLAKGRRVLVTSRGEPALEVLQEKIPEEVRPLTVALLTSDREGLRQFQAAIEAIQHRVSQLDADLTREQIQNAHIAMERAHASLESVDCRIDELALPQLSGVRVDGLDGQHGQHGQPLRAHQISEIVVNGRERYAWFDDAVTLAPEHAPPLTELEADRLRERRRRLERDLVYAQAHLPDPGSLPAPEALARLHEALVGIAQLDEDVKLGSLIPLKAESPEVLGAARQLVQLLDAVHAQLSTFEEFEDPTWLHELRSRCRSTSFASERAALEALFADLDQLVAGRAEWLKSPVEFPSEILAHDKTREAITRASQGGKAVGPLSFGMSDVKHHLAAIKVAGRSAKTAEDWARVDRHLHLLDLAANFSVRWNQLGSELPLPALRVDAVELRRAEQLGTAARTAHHLALHIDPVLVREAHDVFAEVPVARLLGDATELRELRQQIMRHLTRIELSQAHVRVASLRNQVAMGHGPVCDELRLFIDRELGNPELETERVSSHYAILLAELHRVAGRAEELEALEADATRIERAGAPRFA